MWLLSLLQHNVYYGWGFMLVLGALASWALNNVFLSRRINRSNERIETLEHEVAVAHYDELTGLPDRYGAMRTFEAIRAQHTHVSVGVADINGLKRVNDTLGHDAGDAMVIAIATRLVALLPTVHGGLVARLGGDEFVIIAPVSSKELAAAYDDAFIGEDHTASIGIAESEHGDDIFRVAACADIALYAAKRSDGKLRVYDESLGTPEHRAANIGGDRRRGSRRPLGEDI